MAFVDTEAQGNLVLSAIIGRWRLCVMSLAAANVSGSVSPPNMTRVLGVFGTHNIYNGSTVPAIGTVAAATSLNGSAPEDEAQVYSVAANLPVFMFIGV